MTMIKNIFLVLVSSVCGGEVTFLALEARYNSHPILINQDVQIFDEIIEKQIEINKRFDQLLDEKLFKEKDFNHSYSLMRNEMKLRFKMKLKSEQFSNLFDYLFSERFGTKLIVDMSRSEDKEYVFYEFLISNLESTLINTVIDNEFITIFATVNKNEFPSKNDFLKNHQEEFSNHYYRFTLRQVLPLPKNTDYSNMRIKLDYKKNTIVLKFPKIAV